MADRGRGRGGRGDFRGRGRGDGGPRGGGGAGRGDGGTHGGRGGGSFDRGGRGRGGFDRGGGRGRGGFDGGRGGFDRGGSGRGRGGFDGGRGRGGGSRGDRGGGEMKIYGSGSFPNPDAEVTKLEDVTFKDLSTALAATSLDEKFPRRPGYGVKGTPVVLWTNYLEMKGLKPDTVFYRYSIAFQPDEGITKPKKKRLVQLLLRMEPFSKLPVVSDWAQILISTKKIDLGGHRPVYEIEWFPEDGEPLPPPSTEDTPQRVQSRRKNTFRALVEELGTVSIKELMKDLQHSTITYPQKMETIQALNIVLSSGASANNQIVTAVGNKFYPFGTHPQFQSYDLGAGLQAYRGYYTSVRTSINRILINVNVATAAFYKSGPLLDLMRDLGGYQVAGSYRQMITFLKKLRFETNYIRATDKNGKVKMEGKAPVTKRKVHTIGDLSPFNQNSTNVTFVVDGAGGKKETMTVEKFFLKAHDIKLESPNAPLVNYSTKENPKWIPAELCTILGGQLAHRLLQGDQTRRMIEFAARRPFDNAESIEKDGLQVMMIKEGMNNHLTRFGLGVAPKLLTVNGRILQTPTLQYRTKPCTPNNGAWNLDPRALGDKPFRMSKPLGDWNSLIIDCGRPTIRGGIQEAMAHLNAFKNTLNTYGMAPGPVQEPIIVNIPFGDLSGRKVDSIMGTISTTLRTKLKKPPHFLFVLLPSDNAALYDSIKTLCDVQLGIPNICSIAQKFTKEKGQMQYFANVAMKFNQKLGGINHSIDMKQMSPLDANTIVMGIDVTHPSPGSSESSPSIAGVVGSVDSNFAQYPASMRTQKGRQEMVSDLAEMVMERFKLWQKRNGGRLPTKVIVYRDGVSEGQYSIVMREEYPHFVTAFEKLYGKAEKHPKMSFIVVGKRHHTRFYPTDPNGADGKTGNPKPGTVVDRGVTGEKLFDFFLLAHQGLQGTSKPAHYVVLKDDNKLGADQLQNLTHNLCYTFARATRAVSICPPAYYADLLCERGRCYLQSVLKGGNAMENFGRKHWQKDVHPALMETMYYL